jgi:hypothetical protein
MSTSSTTSRVVGAIGVLLLCACSAGARLPVASEGVCADLRAAVPKLREAGFPAAARIELVVDLSSYYQRHQDERPLRGKLLDRTTSAGCPAVRTEVLRVIEKASFSEFFAF